MPATVVIGAGIIGASVTYHLARAGAEVALVDRSRPATGASGTSFAWIGRGPQAADPRQALLRRSVLEDYRRLESELPDLRVRWTGSLSWGRSEQADPRGTGGDRRRVEAEEISRLEPSLRSVPPAALLTSSDGAIDPAAAIDALLRAAREHGATTATGVTVHHLAQRGQRVVGVETSTGFLPAATVVIAAGADASLLCAPLGFDLPVHPSPALLVRLRATQEVVRTLVHNDDIEVRQAADGTLLVALEHHGESLDRGLHEAGMRALEQLQASFSGTAGAELLDARVGVRPMPVDGSPVIGPVPGAPGAYLAVMHSGVTLAATVGRLVAAEVAEGLGAEELQRLRPSRFTERVER